MKVIEPTGRPAVRLGGQELTHVFDSRPNQRWSVQIRSTNAAGESPWSRAIAARTPPAGELIIGPTVSYPRGVPTVSWRSVQGVEDLVNGYKLQYSTQSRPGWQDHSSGMVTHFMQQSFTTPFLRATELKIRYVGYQRPYSVPMPSLPEGETVEVRVIVLDHNNGIQYTSSAVSIQVPAKCRPPARPPSDLTVIPMGTNRIRVTWSVAFPHPSLPALPPTSWHHLLAHLPLGVELRPALVHPQVLHATDPGPQELHGPRLHGHLRLHALHALGRPDPVRQPRRRLRLLPGRHRANRTGQYDSPKLAIHQGTESL